MKKILYISAVIYLLFLTDSFSQVKNIGLVVSLTGSIISDEDHKPATVMMEAYDENNKRVYAGKSNAQERGYYFITGLKPGKKYIIKFVDLDYFNTQTEIEIPFTDKYMEYSKDLLVIPKRPGSTFYIHVPPFESNKSRLRFNASTLLEDAKEAFIKNPRVNFDIVCYPDNSLNPDENRKLTEDRCNSIRNYFVACGINFDRMTILAQSNVDPKNPPPARKQAKGKNYIGPVYFVIK